MKEAVNVCIELNDWGLAFQLTQSSPTSDCDSLQNDTQIKASLRRRVLTQLRASVNRLLDQSHWIEAVDMLKSAGYFLDAAKILLHQAKAIQKKGEPLKKLKMMYVMIGMLIDKHQEQSKSLREVILFAL